MPSDKMIARKDNGVGWMILNNPERHNAISLEMWYAALEIMADFAADPVVRVMVISGAGGKAFASGADISKFKDERQEADAVAHYQATTQRASWRSSLNLEMSAPDANALPPAPEITITRTAGSAAKSAMISSAASHISSEIALWRCGLFRIIQPTPSSFLAIILSLGIGVPLGGRQTIP